MIISRLTTADLDAVDELMKSDRRTLGFLTKEALHDHLEKGSVLGARTGDGCLTDYLLYAAYQDRFRIAQLCVSKEFRNRGIARRLLEVLRDSATTQKIIRLRCRRDFAAHNMWPRLGFVALGETPGRSREAHPLTLWNLTLAPSDQLGLFKASTIDSALEVIIDSLVKSLCRSN